MKRNRKNEPDYVRQARRKVRAKKWFFRHLSLYLVAGFFFFSMNVLDNDLGDPWFLYPVISWGTIVAFQYLLVFGLPFTKAGTSEWEEKEFARELAKRVPSQPAPPVQQLVAETTRVDIDDHLELQEVGKEKNPTPIYRTDDLV